MPSVASTISNVALGRSGLEVVLPGREAGRVGRPKRAWTVSVCSGDEQRKAEETQPSAWRLPGVMGG
jgi:hypothetical protein